MELKTAASTSLRFILDLGRKPSSSTGRGTAGETNLASGEGLVEVNGKS